jgi:predicted transport protein
MPLFSIQNHKLELVKKMDFKLERDIQKLTEENLKEIFGLEFFRTEFQLNNLRIDTLAFDKESNSFIIIEYKKGSSFSVIDQGYAYLALLLNNKADFILEYNESKEDFLSKSNVDWSQSRIIFVSPRFNKHQKYAINFKDLPIELWEISRYINQTVTYNQLTPSESNVSIKTISPKSKEIKDVGKILKSYDEEDYLKNLSDEFVEVYEELKRRILNLGDVEIKPLRVYIAFKSNNNFVDLQFQKKSIKLWLNLRKGQLDDPKNMARDVAGKGHHGNGDYEITLTPDDDLDYLMTLIKQSYKINS